VKKKINKGSYEYKSYSIFLFTDKHASYSAYSIGEYGRNFFKGWE
jgi:hypothetical protein